MLPASPELNEAVEGHLATHHPGYITGSGRIEAVYPGRGEPTAILKYLADDPRLGRVSCIAFAPVGSAPTATGGCGGPPPDLTSKTFGGVSYRSDPGDQEATVEHSPDAEAVVIELDDYSSFVIRPNGSTVSLHRWVGRPPIRITVFWEDGSTYELVLSG